MNKFARYTQVEEKLMELIKLYGINVAYREMRENGGLEINPTNGTATIYLKPQIQEKEYVAARVIIIAHELGHFIDYSVAYSEDLADFHLTQKIDPIFAEQEAWHNAVQVLDQLEWDGWDAFYKIAEYALGTYYVVANEDKQEAGEFIASLLPVAIAN